MKRAYVSVCLMMLVCTGTLFAQEERPAFELNLDYVYLNQAINPIATDVNGTRLFGRQRAGFPGGIGFGVAGNFTRNFGLVADFSFSRRTDVDPNATAATNGELDYVATTTRRNYFLVGPRFSTRSDRANAFFQVLLGGMRFRDEILGAVVAEPLAGEDPTVQFAERKKTAFAMGFGGGFEVNLTDRIGIRPFQVDYLPYRTDGRWHTGYRYKGGIVIRWGSDLF